MSENALRYVLNRHYLSQDNSLKVFYDFTSGTDGYQIIGSSGVINNMLPAANTGTNRALLTHLGGSDPIAFKVTGKFLANSGQGDLSYSNLRISGDLGSNLNDISFLFSFQEKRVQDGIIFGSMQESVATVGGREIIGVSGYNIGVNDNNKLFFQHRDRRGGYIYTANEIPLAQRNIVSFSVGDGSIEFSRFDYTTKKTHSQKFPVNSSSISNSNRMYLGGSPYFYKTASGEATTFSGLLNEFLIFSGALPNYVLYELGSGLIGDYSSTGSSTLTFSSNLTGFQRTLLYPTGVTGYSLTLGTQVDAPLSGIQKVFGQGVTPTELAEGTVFLSGFTLTGLGDVYLEKQGLIIQGSPFTYLPTGSEAYDTLGLQVQSATVDVYSTTLSYLSPNTTGMLVAYAVGLTGYLKEASGYLETPLYETISGISVGQSGLSINPTNLSNYRFDYLKFLCDDTGYFTHKVNTGLSVNPDGFQIYGDYFNTRFLVNTQSGLVTNASLNGQTLLETTALQEYFLGQEIVTNSGSFYVESGESKNTTNLFGFEDSFYYRLRPYSGSAFFSSDTNEALKVGFSGQLGVARDNYDFYLNGVLLTSGIHYIITGNGAFSLQEADTDTTGVLFAVAKPKNFQEFTGTKSYVHGTNFLQGVSLSYLNGIESSNIEFIELTTGIDRYIQTGKSIVSCFDKDSTLDFTV